jgi:hypothetical protein
MKVQNSIEALWTEVTEEQSEAVNGGSHYRCGGGGGWRKHKKHNSHCGPTKKPDPPKPPIKCDPPKPVPVSCNPRPRWC